MYQGDDLIIALSESSIKFENTFSFRSWRLAGEALWESMKLSAEGIAE